MMPREQTTAAPAAPRPRASVVIATYGRGAWLEHTVGAVLRELPDDCELIVVEQNEPPRFDLAAHAPAARGRLAHHAVRPASLPAARNFGLSVARGPIVIFLDDDLTPHPGCIAAHLAAHARTPAPVAVVGRVRVPAEPGPDVRPFPEHTRRRITEGAFDRTASGPVTTVIGCNMSFRREAVLAAGGFDPSFLGAALREEADLVARLARRAQPGSTVWFEAAAAVDHHVAPEGGCRDDRHLDNPVHYRNLCLHAFRHLDADRWPSYLISEYRSKVWWVKGVGRAAFARRSLAFASGVVRAAWRSILPRRLVLRPQTRQG